MVAAAFEPRILSNLIADEKEYHKHLLVLLDTYAHHSLSSLSAFASVSPASVSRSLIVVAGSLAGADDALRRYAGSVEAWETEMGAFKDAYDEVNAAVREREQHVIRLYEDSEKEKSRKGTSIASSLPSPDSSKSDDSQAELKTLESQLEEKKQRMDGLLVEAVRRGLYGRCKAMMECGQTWIEMGQAGLRVLEGIGQGRDGRCWFTPNSRHLMLVSSGTSCHTSAYSSIDIAANAR
ncbi:hypothetical protein BV25DRAFT_1795880 [Artomyces pyxidatus]|uniref:Uncharacterized protein n=1 Tax=Artomyces pyxidatus TaxID=48021 RepID=A0ACB8TF89_9AGAM|nr:hypothetical protein BV25DRAFT_1795880 [Artomyces pyxidatus]